jgi:hypothetical protein
MNVKIYLRNMYHQSEVLIHFEVVVKNEIFHLMNVLIEANF